MTDRTHTGRFVDLADDLWVDPSQVAAVAPHKNNKPDAPVAAITLTNGRDIVVNADYKVIVNRLNGW